MIINALLPLLGALPAPTVAEAQPPLVVQDAEEAVEEPVSPWSGSFAFGGTISSGNNDTRTASSTLDVLWQDDPNRVTLGALWNYQDESSAVIQRYLYGAAQYDRFFTPKFYGLAQTSGNYDLQAGLDLRFTGGVGAGYQFHDDEVWKLGGELGVSYVSEDFRSGRINEYPAGRAAYNFAYTQGTTWEFANLGEIFPSLENGNDVYARMDTRFKLTLTEAMFLQLQWVYNWDNTPEEGKKRSDHILMLTIGWGF